MCVKVHVPLTHVVAREDARGALVDRRPVDGDVKEQFEVVTGHKAGGRVLEGVRAGEAGGDELLGTGRLEFLDALFALAAAGGRVAHEPEPPQAAAT
jgi:hypothetical protein